MIKDSMHIYIDNHTSNCQKAFSFFGTTTIIGYLFSNREYNNLKFDIRNEI